MTKTIVIQPGHVLVLPEELWTMWQDGESVRATLDKQGRLIITSKQNEHLKTPLARLKDKQAELIRRAKDYRAQYGDPIENGQKFFAALIADAKRWREIIEEPYR